MSFKFKNGRVAKAGDAVVGKDWFNRPITGEIVAGKEEGHPELLLKHSLGHLCPSLDLKNFLHREDAVTDGSNPNAGKEADGKKQMADGAPGSGLSPDSCLLTPSDPAK